ncbi:MAG: hypothetical protein ACFFGZ_07640 [Candidatus Thorarchaeota archaeon]
MSEEERDEIEEELEDIDDDDEELFHTPPPPPPPIAPLPPEPPEPPMFHARHGSGGRVKNVTIRGIEAEIYNEFSQQMKIFGMTMGDAITKMMSDVLKDFDETFPDLSAKSLRTRARLPKAVISHHDELTVGAKDLIDANARVTFSHMGLLEIGPDVTRELFLRHIARITHSDTVRIPAVLPKLVVYSRVQFCDTIEIYDVESPKETAGKKEPE